jgi:hypothetical protein
MLRAIEPQQSWRLTIMSKRRSRIERGEKWLPRKVELGKFRSTKLNEKRLLAIECGTERRPARFRNKLAKAELRATIEPEN